MACCINVMQAEVNEVDTPCDTRAHSNHCYGCGEMGHFYQDCDNPNKRQYQEQMCKKKMLTNWQIERQQEFEEEPFEALLAKLMRQKNAYEKKYKQLSKAVTSGKTLVTSEGTKLMAVPRAVNMQFPTETIPKSVSPTSMQSQSSTTRVFQDINQALRLNGKIKSQAPISMVPLRTPEVKQGNGVLPPAKHPHLVLTIWCSMRLRCRTVRQRPRKSRLYRRRNPKCWRSHQTLKWNLNNG